MKTHKKKTHESNFTINKNKRTNDLNAAIQHSQKLLDCQQAKTIHRVHGNESLGSYLDTRNKRINMLINFHIYIDVIFKWHMASTHKYKICAGT